MGRVCGVSHGLAHVFGLFLAAQEVKKRKKVAHCGLVWWWSLSDIQVRGFMTQQVIVIQCYSMREFESHVQYAVFSPRFN